MTPTELAYSSAADLARLMAARKLSPVEVMRATLARAEAVQKATNCFITICAEEAMRHARAAEEAVMKGAALGPLHGVPLSVKDLINTKGVRTTFASAIFETNVPKVDSVSVARLKAAGAILLGKTTTPEFGHKPFTEAPIFGRTSNAWDSTRTSGGSSGGAAVAVAAGAGPLAIATCAGGSTRIPAACNGVVGFKQTSGLVPHDLAPDVFGNLSHVTPTTRTVRDTGLMLEVMGGAHPCDALSLGQSGAGLAAACTPIGSLAGIRMRWRPFLGNTVIDREVLALSEAAAQTFAALGAGLEPMEDDVEPLEPFWLALSGAGWVGRFAKYLPEWRARMTPTLVEAIERGERVTMAELQAAIYRRTEIYRQVQGWFANADVIVMPALTRTALAIDHPMNAPIEIEGKPTDTVRRAWYPYTHPFNLTGHPAVVLPAGHAKDGLPVAIQLVGRRGEDALLLKVATHYEEARPWAHVRPAIPGLDGVKA